MLFSITLLVGSSVNALADLPRGGLRLAGDNGPHCGGTNPYGSAKVFVRVTVTATEREDVIARVRELQQIYGFSWNGSVCPSQAGPPGFDDFAIRIALDRRDIPALSREAGVFEGGFDFRIFFLKLPAGRLCTIVDRRTRGNRRPRRGTTSG